MVKTKSGGETSSIGNIADKVVMSVVRIGEKRF